MLVCVVFENRVEIISFGIALWNVKLGDIVGKWEKGVWLVCRDERKRFLFSVFFL